MIFYELGQYFMSYPEDEDYWDDLLDDADEFIESYNQKIRDMSDKNELESIEKQGNTCGSCIHFSRFVCGLPEGRCKKVMSSNYYREGMAVEEDFVCQFFQSELRDTCNVSLTLDDDNAILSARIVGKEERKSSLPSLVSSLRELRRELDDVLKTVQELNENGVNVQIDIT